MQEKTGVGWKRTSKCEVVSWLVVRELVARELAPGAESRSVPDLGEAITVPRDGVGKMDIRMRAMESTGMS